VKYVKKDYHMNTLLSRLSRLKMFQELLSLVSMKEKKDSLKTVLMIGRELLVEVALLGVIEVASLEACLNTFWMWPITMLINSMKKKTKRKEKKREKHKKESQILEDSARRGKNGARRELLSSISRNKF